MAENREVDGAENLNPQHQPGGGDGASPSQIGSIAANNEPQRSQNDENLLGLDGVSAIVIDSSESNSGGETQAAAELSSSLQVGSNLASSEPLIAVSTTGYLSASQDAARGTGRPKNFLPPLPPYPSQTSIAGGGVKPANVPRAAGASVISRTEPPRGIDPALHHRDASANLAAAAKLLSSSGSQLPKVLNPPMMKNSSNTVQSHATGSSGPDAAHSQGSSRTRFHLCTPEFLAAAADKFFSLSAEDLADAIAPIVPNIAACRGDWKSKFWAGSYLLAMETPESCKAEMSQWKSDGIACLSIEEIDATVMCIAKIIKTKSGTFNMAGPWYRHVRNEFPGHELPLFTSLTEEQTFNFVLELCPHLKRLHDAWVLNGLSTTLIKFIRDRISRGGGN